MSKIRQWVTVYTDADRKEIFDRYWMRYGDDDAGVDERQVTDPENWVIVHESAGEVRDGKFIVFSSVRPL